MAAVAWPSMRRTTLTLAPALITRDAQPVGAKSEQPFAANYVLVQGADHTHWVLCEFTMGLGELRVDRYPISQAEDLMEVSLHATGSHPGSGSTSRGRDRGRSRMFRYGARRPFDDVDDLRAICLLPELQSRLQGGSSPAPQERSWLPPWA